MNLYYKFCTLEKWSGTKKEPPGFIGRLCLYTYNLLIGECPELALYG